MPMRKYLGQPHRPDCDCSVCWTNRELAKPRAPSRSALCDQCRPASVLKVDGRLHITPAFICAKHTPSKRPPKYWQEYSNTGRPTPFVPIHEPFED